MDNYIEDNSIMTYINDSIAQLLIHKNECAKLDIKDFFYQYFKTVKNGSHVALREFAFVNSTPYNRGCFLDILFSSYGFMVEHKEPVSIEEYLDWLTQLCKDFPKQILDDCFKILDASKGAAKFTDFLYVFQFHFYYNEFSSAILNFKSTGEHKLSSNNLNYQILQEILENLYKQKALVKKLPNIAVINEILEKDYLTKVEFPTVEFLAALASNDKVLALIGRIPERSRLSDRYNALRASKDVNRSTVNFKVELGGLKVENVKSPNKESSDSSSSDSDV